MGFMDAYKHLEKLCGEIFNDKRQISAYIEEMESLSRGAYLVRGWDTDLKQLKHYRRVRNQIAHDPGCTEENMCDSSDTQWILNFRSRIMNQTDPLALYRKAMQPYSAPATYKQVKQAHVPKPDTYKRAPKSPVGCVVFLVCAVLVIAAILVWFI